VACYFLLATSVLCAYLQQVRGETATAGAEGGTSADTIRASLRRSYGIWLNSSSSSKEAQKAVSALSVILGSQNSMDTNTNSETDMSFDQLPTSPGTSVSFYPQSE
jgi:hypothetical protein